MYICISIFTYPFWFKGQALSQWLSMYGLYISMYPFRLNIHAGSQKAVLWGPGEAGARGSRWAVMRMVELPSRLRGDGCEGISLFPDFCAGLARFVGLLGNALRLSRAQWSQGRTVYCGEFSFCLQRRTVSTFGICISQKWKLCIG